MKELVAMFSLTVYNSAAVDLSVREWSTVWSRSCDDLPGCALPVRKEDYGFFLNLIGSPLASQYIDSISRDDTMKIVRVIVFLLLLTNVLAIVSNINLNPTGNYAKISTKGGLYVSITILIFMIFGEFGYLPFSRFVGRKKRSAVSQMMALSHHGNRNLVLQVPSMCFLLLMSIIIVYHFCKMIRSIDHRDCLLRYLCELEALRLDAEKNGTGPDPGIEEDFFLLKVAKYIALFKFFLYNIVWDVNIFFLILLKTSDASRWVDAARSRFSCSTFWSSRFYGLWRARIVRQRLQFLSLQCYDDAKFSCRWKLQ